MPSLLSLLLSMLVGEWKLVILEKEKLCWTTGEVCGLLWETGPEGWARLLEMLALDAGGRKVSEVVLIWVFF